MNDQVIVVLSKKGRENLNELMRKIPSKDMDEAVMLINTKMEIDSNTMSINDFLNTYKEKK